MAKQKHLIETTRLKIRPALANEKDALFLISIWNNPDLMKNVGFPKGLELTLEKTLPHLQDPKSSDTNRKVPTLIIELKSTGEPIGECKMGPINKEGEAETDIKLHPKFWGHKYGVEIKRALIRYLFTKTNCTSVIATPNIQNIASIKMQETVGGKRIKEDIYHFPEGTEYVTEPIPHYVYSVKKEDWEKTV